MVDNLNPNFSAIKNFLSMKSKSVRLARGDFQPETEFNETLFEANFFKSMTIDLEEDDFEMAADKVELTSYYLEENRNEENKKIGTNGDEIYITPNTSLLLNQPQTGKKYKIETGEKSLIVMPPEYTTDDEDLKIVIDFFNEDTTKGWKKVSDDKNFHVFKKMIEGVPQVIIKSMGIVEDVSKEEMLDALWDIGIRREWDKVCKEFKLIQKNEDESELIYMAIQPPLAILSPRDFVQKRKVWKKFQPDEDSLLIHFKSVPHESHPPTKKFIRAETIISGYYMKTISTNPKRTFFSGIVHNDVKGKIPNWVINYIAPKFPKEWINALRKSCLELRKKHGNNPEGGFNR